MCLTYLVLFQKSPRPSYEEGFIIVTEWCIFCWSLSSPTIILNTKTWLQYCTLLTCRNFRLFPSSAPVQVKWSCVAYPTRCVKSCVLLDWIYFRFRCGTGKLKCHRFLTRFAISKNVVNSFESNSASHQVLNYAQSS